MERNNPRVSRRCDIPHGSISRLVFAYIIGEAVRRKTATIDMGESLRQFMNKMGFTIHGRKDKEISKALEDIAATSFLFTQWSEEEDKYMEVVYAKMVNKVRFWLESESTSGDL